MGARWSMPLVDEVNLATDYQTGTTILDSIMNRAICEDLEVRWGNGGNGLKQKVFCWDGDILLSTSVMTVGIVEACAMEEWKAAHWREKFYLKPVDWDRVDSDGEIVCCSNLSSSGAVCLQWRGFDDDHRLVEDVATRLLLEVDGLETCWNRGQLGFFEDCFNWCRADKAGDGSGRLQLNFHKYSGGGS